MGLLKNLFARGNKPDLEKEFWDLMQQKTFELFAAGADQADVPRLAVNGASDILMNKYGLSMDEMVKIVKKALQRFG